MCLISFEREPAVAQEDIVVYKAVRVIDGGDLMSPICRNIRYRIGASYKEKHFDRTWSGCDLSYTVVEYGYHTFGKEDDALDYASALTEAYHADHCVLKCVIPKGTRYYSGRFNRRSGVHCSEVLTVKKKLYTVHYVVHEHEEDFTVSVDKENHTAPAS